MTRLNSTYIVGIIDRSGSMKNISRDMSNGWNQFVYEQKKLDGDLRISLVEFDNHYSRVYWNKNPRVDYVPPYFLHPRGSTALLDALGATIVNVGSELAQMEEHDRPSQVLFIVITDGYENSSRMYSSDRIAQMIAHQTSTYSWQFTYLGANQDAILEASKYNFAAHSSLTYQSSSEGVIGAFNSLQNSTTTYRGSGKFSY